jgi:inner membrane protein involved in colicin E2 resistance
MIKILKNKFIFDLPNMKIKVEDKKGIQAKKRLKIKKENL